MVFSVGKYPHGCKRPHSLHLQPSFFRWLHHPSCGLDLFLQLHRLCRLGQGLIAQIVVQILVLTVVYGFVGKAFPELCLQILTGCPPCRVIVKETADSGVVCQYAHRLCEIGNGVQYDVVLRGQLGALRIVPHTDGKERKVIHEALEKITHTSWLSLLSNMGDVLWSDTAFEVSVAHLIAPCHIREADGEIWLTLVLKTEFLAYPLGEFSVYPTLLQIGQQRRRGQSRNLQVSVHRF